MALKRYIFLVLAPALLLGCAASTETRKKDEAQQMQRLMERIDGLKASLDDSRSRLDELDNKFYLLHEKVESSRQDIDKMASLPEDPPEGLKVVSLTEHGHADTGDAVKKAPQKPAQKASKARAAAPATEKTGPELNKKAETPDEMYSRGQDLFLSGRHEEARGVFLSLADAHPGHDLADNAIYWAGETHYTEKDFSGALSRFIEAAEKYPAGNKAPDALLKAGFSCMEMNDNARARGYFLRLVAGYPGSEAAGKARKTLLSLSGN